MGIMVSWLAISVLTMALLTNLSCALVEGQYPDMICPHTELPTVIISDGENQTCLLSSLVNTSNNSSMMELNMTNETQTQYPVSIKDTGFMSEENYEALSLVVVVILTPITTVLGLVGNMLSLVMLMKHKPRNTITIYLISLCVADLLVLLCSVIISTERIIHKYDRFIGFKLRMFSFESLEVFGINVATRISGYITVVLSIERTIAVKLPFAVKQTFLNRHPWKIVIFICFFMVLFFFPLFFQYDVSVGTNYATNQSYLVITTSQFAKASEFYVYLDVATQILTRILPMVIVLVCNLVIIITLIGSARYRKNMTSRPNRVEDIKTTRLLLRICAIFLICTTPGTVHKVVANFSVNYGILKTEHYLFRSFSTIAPFLDILNSSVNFIVYVLSGTKFRDAFFKMWRPLRRKREIDRLRNQQV